MYFEASPTCSATLVRKAMTSWLVVCSISATRVASNPARASISATASSGILPSRFQARTAASSTSSQVRSLASSVQMAPISGSV